MSSRSPDGVFYLTTPIYYINGPPASRPRVHDDRGRHDGPLPPARRGRRLLPDGHRRARGQDRPGGRARRASRPQALADRNSKAFRDEWDALGITYDDFIRTTEPRHARVVQAGSCRRSSTRARSTSASTAGQYCYGCERFYTEKEIVDGKCPDHQTPLTLHRGGELLLPDVGVPGLAAALPRGPSGRRSSPSATGTSSWASCGSRSRTCRSAARRAGSSGASRSRSTTGS